MLVWLADYLSQFYSAFSVVQYLTLRGIFAVVTALVISWVFGPAVIRKLNQLQMGQAIRGDGPQSHLSKAGTPTMGGALILLAVFISTLLWADLGNRYVWIVLGTTLTFGLVGWVDDYRKVVEKDPRGLPRPLEISVAVFVWLDCSFGTLLHRSSTCRDRTHCPVL